MARSGTALACIIICPHTQDCQHALAAPAQQASTDQLQRHLSIAAQSEGLQPYPRRRLEQLLSLPNRGNIHATSLSSHYPCRALSSFA